MFWPRLGSEVGEKGYLFWGGGNATGNLLASTKDKSLINEMLCSKIYKIIGSKQVDKERFECGEDGLCVNSSHSGAGTTLNMMFTVTNSNCPAQY